MALSLRAARSAGHNPPHQYHHRSVRQRKRPEMHECDPTTRTGTHMYREGGDSGHGTDAATLDSDSGTTDDKEQQQVLEQNISQPATAAAAAGHAAPLAKKRRCQDTSGGGSHPLLQLPDGGKAAKMALRISDVSQLISVPMMLARACPSVPHTMMLLLTIDGVPAGVAAREATLKVTSVNAKQGSRHILSAPWAVMRSFIGYTVTQLTINSRSTEITAHLQSPEARKRAEAEEAEALSAGIAAAAAVLPGNWKSASARGSGLVFREQHREAFPPAALLEDAFGTDAEYPLKCLLGVFVNEHVIGRTYRMMKFHKTRGHTVFIPPEYREQLRGSGVVRFRAAAPNFIEVYFRTPTSSASAPAAPPTPLLNIGITPVSAPSRATASNQHTVVVEAATRPSVGTGAHPAIPSSTVASQVPEVLLQKRIANNPVAVAAAPATVKREPNGSLQQPQGPMRLLRPAAATAATATAAAPMFVDLVDSERDDNLEAAVGKQEGSPHPGAQGAGRYRIESGPMNDESTPAVTGTQGAGMANAATDSPTQATGTHAAQLVTNTVPGTSQALKQVPKPALSGVDTAAAGAAQTMAGTAAEGASLGTASTAAGGAAPITAGAAAGGAALSTARAAAAAGAGPSTAAAAAIPVAFTPSTPTAGRTTSCLGFSLEPFETVEQAIEQLVVLFDRLSAPDELMKELQIALLTLHSLGDQQSSCKRIGLFKAQYSIARFWVVRGDAHEALHAVRILLAKATGG